MSRRPLPPTGQCPPQDGIIHYTGSVIRKSRDYVSIVPAFYSHILSDPRINSVLFSTNVLPFVFPVDICLSAPSSLCDTCLYDTSSYDTYLRGFRLPGQSVPFCSDEPEFFSVSVSTPASLLAIFSITAHCS